jgi:hypothetical protein
MTDTLVFLHDDPQHAERVAALYRESGWSAIAAGTDSSGALELIAENRPLAAVFCLDGARAFDACSLAEALLYDQRGIRPLMIFVGGSERDAQKARAMVPVGLFVRSDELPLVLDHLALLA